VVAEAVAATVAATRPTPVLNTRHDHFCNGRRSRLHGLKALRDRSLQRAVAIVAPMIASTVTDIARLLAHVSINCQKH